MMIVGNASVCVTEFRHGGVDVACYQTRLAMVLKEIERGTIGDGWYGSAAHLEALQQVVAEAQRVIAEAEPAAADVRAEEDEG